MGLFEQLPVFKESYDLHLYLIRLSENVRKDLKSVYGERLLISSFNVLQHIMLANKLSNEQKRDHIEQAVTLIPEIFLILRVLHDIRQISTNQYALCSQHILSISKQLQAWKKYAKDNSL